MDLAPETMSASNKILCVGLVCVDTVHEVAFFPKEDSDQRSVSQYRQTGGNASNNCTVLGIFGIQPHFFGTIADCEQRKFIEDNFKQNGVDASSAIVVEGCENSSSCIINSMASGSRTIIHSKKNSKEPTLEDFSALNLDQYTWIHFEGRNIKEVKRMIDYVCKRRKERNLDIKISVEIEKVGPKKAELLPLADVVFVSKDYAQYRGYENMKDALENLANSIKEKSTLICAWGEKGAGAKIGLWGPIILSPPFPPKQVVDSLGAGDTFNASTILALSVGESVKKSITFGCRVAGFKVGVRGWSGFKKSVHELDFIKEFVHKSLPSTEL